MHPIVQRIFQEMLTQQVTYSDLADRAGITRETISAWRTRNSPSLANVVAVLGVLGYELEVVETRD